jgi:hypothetical protein
MTPESAALLRAVRGPVMMITVGILFALDNFTPFSFNRTWPILLVVSGILSLGKGAPRMRGNVRYQAQWGPPRPPGPPFPPPPPPPPSSSWAPSGTATAPPGSYRGSSYDANPGSAPRSSEEKEKRSTPPDPGVTL